MTQSTHRCWVSEIGTVCVVLCVESKMSCFFPTGEIVQIMEQKNVSMKDVTEVAVDSL